MFKVKVRFKPIGKKFESYKDALTKHMEKHRDKAIKVWLRRALTKIPVYTGTARGTMIPVGRIVNQTIYRGPISKKAKWKKHFKYQGVKYPIGFRQGANYAMARSYRRGLTWVFVYDNELLYFLWNEARPGPPWLKHATPWRAIRSANTAYKRYVREIIFKTIPKITDKKFTKELVQEIGI